VTTVGDGNLDPTDARLAVKPATEVNQDPLVSMPGASIQVTTGNGLPPLPTQDDPHHGGYVDPDFVPHGRIGPAGTFAKPDESFTKSFRTAE